MSSRLKTGFSLQLIVGLGNTGNKYKQTRHNAGFWFLDELAAQQAVSFRYEQKFNGEVACMNIAGKPCYLLKPHTFMNHSGQAVGALLNYYKIAPKNMLVAHDELDFEPGVVRFKCQGGHGGHNGLRDIIRHTGEKGFLRLRLGIGHPRDCSHPGDVSNFVLTPPSRGERQRMDEALNEALCTLPLLWEKGLEAAVQQLHQG